MENIASLLIKAFGSDFANFHDEPNNVSRGIFRAFINGSAKLFHKVASGVDKTSALPLMKFVAIAISFGPDRALRSPSIARKLRTDHRELHRVLGLQISTDALPRVIYATEAIL